MNIHNYLHVFIMAFVQIFIAIDVLGILPLYVSMVESVQENHRKAVLRASLLAGLLLGTLFLFLGRILLHVLGIAISDFEIAGGLILLLMGVMDLLGEEKNLRKPVDDFSIVPLGIPLIVGPATVSVLFLLVDHAGYVVTLLAFIVNLFIVGLAFTYADRISRFLGKNIIKAISKVMMLLLIAVGIRMLRLGILAAFPFLKHS